jgi:Uma2 family endonuclease
VPDLAGWRQERLPHLPEEAHFTLAPDWACEVISPRSASNDRVKKMRIYAREGVPNVWLIDPIGKTLEVFRLEQRRWILVSTHAEDEKIRAEPFDAIELALVDWWTASPDDTQPSRPGGS